MMEITLWYFGIGILAMIPFIFFILFGYDENDKTIMYSLWLPSFLIGSVLCLAYVGTMFGIGYR